MNCLIIGQMSEVKARKDFDISRFLRVHYSFFTSFAKINYLKLFLMEVMFSDDQIQKCFRENKFP